MNTRMIHNAFLTKHPNTGNQVVQQMPYINNWRVKDTEKFLDIKSSEKPAYTFTFS